MINFIFKVIFTQKSRKKQLSLPYLKALKDGASKKAILIRGQVRCFLARSKSASLLLRHSVCIEQGCRVLAELIFYRQSIRSMTLSNQYFCCSGFRPEDKPAAACLSTFFVDNLFTSRSRNFAMLYEKNVIFYLIFDGNIYFI